MGDQQQQQPSTKQIRRGRRRQEGSSSVTQDNNNERPLPDATPTTPTQKKKHWTRSLSPRRSCDQNTTNGTATASPTTQRPVSGDDATIVSQLSESFSNSVFVAPVLNSFKRWRSARSQSPRRRPALDDATLPPAAAAILARNDSHDSSCSAGAFGAFELLEEDDNTAMTPPKARPERLHSAPTGSSSSPKEFALQGRSHSTEGPQHQQQQKRRSRSSSSAGGSRRNNNSKGRSRSPRRPGGQRSDNNHYSKSTLKPPSGMNLIRDLANKKESDSREKEQVRSPQKRSSGSSHGKDSSQKPKTTLNAESPRSSRSLGRPRSKRRLVSEGDKQAETTNPSSSRSLVKPLPRKPSSDPGKGNAAGQKTTKREGSKKQTDNNKPPSTRNLASSSHHEKPSSDPGRPASTAAVDRVPRPSPTIINRPNLNKESLQHVEDVKESFRRMRTQQYSHRHKVKFDGTMDGTSGTIASVGPAPKSKSAPPATVAQVASMATNFQDSHGSLSSDGLNQSITSSRLQGITIEDLDVGHLKTPTTTKRTLDTTRSPQAAALSPVPLNSTHEEKAEALKKAIRKSKKLVKRCCRDVWTERDEIVHLQRTNWGIRKALLQTDAPKDTITTLNLKLEKAIREEREITAELEGYQAEKQQVELECSQLAKTIEEFKNLLDALNTQVVPLFPSDAGSRDDAAAYFQSFGTKAASAVINLLDDDDFSDSIHSTDV